MSMYMLDGALLGRNLTLGRFFKSENPDMNQAKKLKREYENHLYENGELVGVDAVSPIVIAILLGKLNHFRLLVGVLQEAIISNEHKHHHLETNYIKTTIFDALNCALQEEKRAFHDHVLEQSPIKDFMAKSPADYRFVRTFFTKETEQQVLASLHAATATSASQDLSGNSTDQPQRLVR